MRPCINYGLLLFLLLLLGSCGSSSTKPKQAAITDSVVILLPKNSSISEAERMNINFAVRSWYDSFLQNGGFNGGILVAKGGNIVFEQYKGVGHLGGNDTITRNTPFNIASVSKTITAMAILKLYEEGKLKLDDELNKYFPEFNYPGVTVRNLLNHRSGLPNYLYFMEDLGWNKSIYINNQDILNYLVNRKSEIKNIATPDSRFNYCNTNYALLALLAEKITGKSFPEYINKSFFYPLSMKNSFVFTLSDSANVNPSYDYRGQMIPLNYLDLVYGDKNVFSTPEDMLIWDRALRSNMLFKKETLEQAYAPYSNERPGIRNYGLGWRMNIYPGDKKMIYHNGWWHGYNASFIRLIDEDATIIVMGNRYTSSVYKAKYLTNIFTSGYLTQIDEENESAVIRQSRQNPVNSNPTGTSRKK